MSSFLIQFHALPDEIAPVLVNFARTMNLIVVGQNSPPFSCTRIHIDEDAGESLFAYWRIVLIDVEKYAKVESAVEFSERYPGAFYWEVGRLDSSGLQMSTVGARTLVGPLNPKWEKIAGKLKSVTRAGGIAVNHKTGATSRMRNHRFSEGAEKLYHYGVRLLPLVGNIEIKPQ